MYKRAELRQTITSELATLCMCLYFLKYFTCFATKYFPYNELVNMAVPASRHPYNALPTNHIRLLRRHGNVRSIFTYDLINTPLDVAPTYEALSYVWGRPRTSTLFAAWLRNSIDHSKLRRDLALSQGAIRDRSSLGRSDLYQPA